MIKDALSASRLNRPPVEPSFIYSPHPDNSLSAFSISGEGCAELYRLREVSPRLNERLFWETLLERGLICRGLYSNISSRIPTRASKVLQDAAAIPFDEIAWKLGESERGRTILLEFITSLDRKARHALADASVPSQFSASGFIPMTSNSPRISGARLEDAPHELTERWFKALRSELRTSDSQFLWQVNAPSPIYSAELSFLSQNVWGVPGLIKDADRRFAAQGDYLSTAPFDVVALQEMWDPRTAQILERSNYTYIVTSPGFPGLTFRAGLAICSRLPILQTYHLTFQSYGGVESVVRKGALAARVLSPDGTHKLIVTTHLVSPSEKLSYLLCSERRISSIRTAQIKEISAWIKQISAGDEEDVITLGDFNAPDGSAEYQTMCRELGSDLYRSRLPLAHNADRLRRGATFTQKENRLVTNGEDARFDYIFGRFAQPDAVDLQVNLLRSDKAPWSDHFGVIASIRWNGKTQRRIAHAS